ncbi:MAG: hypothetical protein M1833_005714 [Piccolia ochrophora]|nr:MAG: hypothetical protein M1833_005714 [Piccolia ochrophora]
MTSHPPAQCCTLGVKHEGEPRGGDDAARRGVADQFAENGYLTAIPDILAASPVPPNRPAGFVLDAWLAGPPAQTPQRIDPVVESVIAALRNERGVGEGGWGGYALRHLRPDKLASVFMAHPSFITAEELRSMGRRAAPASSAGRGEKVSLSIAAASTDDLFPAAKRRETEDILKEMEQGVAYQMCLYGGVKHGFAMRADVKDRGAEWAKEAAFRQAVEWMGEWL